MAPDGFFDKVIEGKIIVKQGGVTSFTKNGILLDNGELIEADVVILATGFKH